MINSTLFLLPRHIAPTMLQVSRILLIYLLLLLAWLSTLLFLSCVNDLIETKKNYIKNWLLRISVFQLRCIKLGQDTDQISRFSDFWRYLWFISYVMDINFSICFGLEKYGYSKNMLIFADIYDTYGYIFLFYR